MKKNGFMATSLIYSFFLVFLMLMMTLLAKDVSNRVLLKAVKDEIREELEQDSGFVVDKIESTTYVTGTDISFAGEDWKVMKDNGASILLILQRTLTRGEIANALGIDTLSNNAYYGTCDETSCQVRACREVPAFDPSNPPTGIYGRETCFYDPRNPTEYIKPAFDPSISQVENEDYGQTIPGLILENWFHSHLGLQRALNLGKLKELSFNDGFLNYNATNKIYVRIPFQSEVILSSNKIWSDYGQPYHVLSNAGVLQGTQSSVYGPTFSTSTSTITGYIRPVIEVIEG